jgi:hypothetical protein
MRTDDLTLWRFLGKILVSIVIGAVVGFFTTAAFLKGKDIVNRRMEKSTGYQEAPCG